MDTREHWETIYSTKSADEVSWYQPEARLSLELVASVALPPGPPIIDVGGGVSRFVDGLLAAGYTDLTVLDLSESALAKSRARLGAAAAAVRWIVGDALDSALAPAAYGIWHDRAVFHFLTDPADRARYFAQLRAALRPGGYALLATFADDGPERCSGLPVVRYDEFALQSEFGPDFTAVAARREMHTTPWGAQQSFVYCLMRYAPAAGTA